MKTLIFGDTHLSARIHPKKLAYLKSIIEPADRVVIAGDFWDGFITTFDKFVDSEWSQLFPLLRQRQTIYLYGNHDQQNWCDHRVNLFSTQQAHVVNLESFGQSYHITHGHTVFVSYEDRFPIFNRRPFLRIGATIDRIHKLTWGNRFLAKTKTINDPMRHYAKTQLAAPAILVCGHSHYPEVDLEHRILNPGFIGMGYGNHLILDEKGIKLVKERY